MLHKADKVIQNEHGNSNHHGNAGTRVAPRPCGALMTMPAHDRDYVPELDTLHPWELEAVRLPNPFCHPSRTPARTRTEPAALPMAELLLQVL